jgi:hypothetical protein
LDGKQCQMLLEQSSSGFRKGTDRVVDAAV